MSTDIKKNLRKFLPHLKDAKDNGLKEADTVTRVSKFLEAVLGYNEMSEVTKELAMKGKFLDIAVKVDEKIRFLVEVKAAGKKLQNHHTDQADNYGSKNGIHWVILTNGTQWRLNRIVGKGDQIVPHSVFDVDLCDAAHQNETFKMLELLHRESVRNDGLETFWEKKNNTSPKVIAKSLFSETVLMMLRRELRKQQGTILEIDELGNLLKQMLSAEALRDIGNIKILKNSIKKVPVKSILNAQQALEGLSGHNNQENDVADINSPGGAPAHEREIGQETHDKSKS